MQAHACFVWKTYVENSGFEKILLIAHSAGGACTSAIQKVFSETFYDQVKYLAFTDSWLTKMKDLTKDQQDFM